jgi:hypothetical protein
MELLKQIWNDNVWGKVIASIIFSSSITFILMWKKIKHYYQLYKILKICSFYLKKPSNAKWFELKNLVREQGYSISPFSSGFIITKI